MKKVRLQKSVSLLVAFLLFFTFARVEDSRSGEPLRNLVDAVVHPLMEEHGVPGMAVAVTLGGRRHVFHYGVASQETGRKVFDGTLFEIGSVTKTLTATLAAYAVETGILSLSDPASRHLPALAGGVFDRVSLLDLGTYTAGGLPLQFPNGISDHEDMIAYYRNWRPDHAAGTHRRYSNPSIGLFGHLAARSMGEPFDALMEGRLFPMLDLERTWIHVPPERLDDYAQGYRQDGRPVRVAPGLLDAEAYGVKTTATDLLHFVEAHMDGALEPRLRRALATTRTGYYRVGEMVQGLGWEMYERPLALDRLLAGNSRKMALEANKATRLSPPLPPQADVLANKTGSTNGFGAYVAFIPSERLGVVMLANRNYPVQARVDAAYRILSALKGASGAPMAD